MSNIVERLRAGIQCDEAGNRCRTMDARSGCVCAEAADEIERLRAEIERLRAALEERCPVDAMDQEGMTPAQAAIWHVWGERCSDFEPECLTCRAWAEFGQIARLRAALDAICMMDISWVGDAFKLKDIARAALEEKQ